MSDFYLYLQRIVLALLLCQGFADGLIGLRPADQAPHREHKQKPYVHRLYFFQTVDFSSCNVSLCKLNESNTYHNEFLNSLDMNNGMNVRYRFYFM